MRQRIISRLPQFTWALAASAVLVIAPLSAQADCGKAKHVSEIFGQSSYVPQAPICAGQSVSAIEPRITVSEVHGRSGAPLSDIGESAAAPAAFAAAPVQEVNGRSSTSFAWRTPAATDSQFAEKDQNE